jgi:hypothetical protein
MTKLSPALKPIYDLELTLGNEVERVDEPAGSECPYAVIFTHPLHFDEIEQGLVLPRSVVRKESRDPHYPIEGGYKCESTQHVVAGPIY